MNVTTVDQKDYQPIAGDISLQPASAFRFTVRKYDGQNWEQVGNVLPLELIQKLTAMSELIGESQGNIRYYRGSGVSTETAPLLDRLDLNKDQSCQLLETGELWIADMSTGKQIKLKPDATRILNAWLPVHFRESE